MARPGRHRGIWPLRAGLGLAGLLLAVSAAAMPLRLSLETAAMQDLATGDVAEARLPLFEATDLQAPAPVRRDPADAATEGEPAERQWQRGSEPLAARAGDTLPASAAMASELELPGDAGRGDIARADDVALEAAGGDPQARNSFAEAVAEPAATAEPLRSAAAPAAAASRPGAEVQVAAPPALGAIEREENRHMMAWLVVPMVLVAALYWASTVIARADADRKRPSRRRRRVRRA